MDIRAVHRQTQALRYACYENGREIAHAYLYCITNDGRAEPYGLLEDVFVDESMRGKGVGTALVRHVIAEARSRGCCKLIGTSRYARQAVHAWYEKIGFKDYGKEFRMDFDL